MTAAQSQIVFHFRPELKVDPSGAARRQDCAWNGGGVLRRHGSAKRASFQQKAKDDKGSYDETSEGEADNAIIQKICHKEAPFHTRSSPPPADVTENVA